MILRECSRLLILFVSLLLTVVEAQGPCSIADNYAIVPPNDTYALPGDQFVIRIEHNTLPPSGLTNLSDSDTACTDESPSTCILDVNQGLLNITDFQPHFAGSYRFVFSFGFGADDICEVDFHLHEAIPPTISNNGDENIMLSSDQGLLLMPTINHGLPPGVVRWYKDGVFLLEGDTYQVEPVAQASDRGMYTATIVHSTVNANTSTSVMYNVFVDFAPQVQLKESVNGGVVELRCDAIGYPIITSIDLVHIVNGASMPTGAAVTINNQIEDDNSFTAFATFTTSEANCNNQQYRCSVENEVSTVQKTINICEIAPTIDNLQVDNDATTNVSIALSWMIVPQGTSVASYRYYVTEVESDTLLQNDTFSTNGLTYNIQGLSPGVMYSIRLRAMNNNGYGDYSETIMARPFTVPVGRPRSVDIISDTRDGRQYVFLEWDEVESLDHAPVTHYDVIYHSSSNQSPVVVTDVEGPKYNLSTLEVDLDTVYFFKVRAANDWGFGSESAEVEFRFEIRDPRVRVNLTLLEPKVTNTMVTLQWTLSDETNVNYVLIEVERILVGSTQNEATTYIPVHERNTTNSNTNSECFSNLNRSDVYRFCVIAVMNSGERVTSCVQVVTGRDTPDESPDRCEPVEPFAESTSVIPSWVIAVVVVVCVMLVVIFFGGCGLYFGLKRTRKGDANFDSPNQSFDKIPQPTNGYPSYPPAPPSHKPVSPGSSCMICKSNRHNNHAHQMDWRVTNPVETTVV